MDRISELDKKMNKMTMGIEPFSEQLKAIAVTMRSFNIAPTPENVLSWAENVKPLEDVCEAAQAISDAYIPDEHYDPIKLKDAVLRLSEALEKI